MNTITSEDVNAGLDSVLKSKGLYSDRLIALQRFHDSKKHDIKHGINIQTELSLIEYSHDTLKIGITKIRFGDDNYPKDDHNIHNGNDGMKIFTLPEFMHDQKGFSRYKDKVSAIVKERFDIENDGSRILNKLDYLHMTLADIKIMIFDDDYIIEDGTGIAKTFNVERLLEGNNYNHLIMIAGKRSRLNIYIRTTHPNNYDSDDAAGKNSKNSGNGPKNNITTDFSDIIVDEDSNIKIIEERILSDNDIIYGRKTVEIGNRSSVNWINIDKDSRLALIEQKTILKGDDCRSTMSNILCGRNSQYTIYNVSEHVGKDTQSLMQNRCGLRSSKAIVRGLVQIDNTAENSNGYQKSDILLMDNESRGISMPDLKIHNDKVKCSHGSSITRLDEEKIFYLESRGLERSEAERLLIEGFYEKILADIDDETLRDKIRLEVLE